MYFLYLDEGFLLSCESSVFFRRICDSRCRKMALTLDQTVGCVMSRLSSKVYVREFGDWLSVIIVECCHEIAYEVCV